MSATWIADDLRAAGLTVVEAPGWKLRGKQPFTPKVVIAHHTAGASEGDAPSLNLCVNGRSGLPGPLCHVLLSRSGVCHIVASGIANHAGAGSWRGVSGNQNALGIEAENTGRGEPWPSEQIEAFHRCSAVLLRHIGRDESWLCGHKEWTPRKIDPAGLDMDDFRAAVRSYLEDDMPAPTDIVRVVPAGIHGIDGRAVYKLRSDGTLEFHGGKDYGDYARLKPEQKQGTRRFVDIIVDASGYTLYANDRTEYRFHARG